MKRGNKKGQEITGSSLLSPLENEKLDDLLGRRCQVGSGGQWEQVEGGWLKFTI